jgi:hypothetical protein
MGLAWMLGALLMGSTARADVSCPWTSVETAEATVMTVTVNDTLYEVRGYEARTQFERMLVACGERDAAYSFQDWRRMRRWTNAAVVIGFPSVGAFWVVAGFTAINASGRREDMLQALRAPRR